MLHNCIITNQNSWLFCGMVFLIHSSQIYNIHHKGFKVLRQTKNQEYFSITFHGQRIPSTNVTSLFINLNCYDFNLRELIQLSVFISLVRGPCLRDISPEMSKSKTFYIILILLSTSAHLLNK